MQLQLRVLFFICLNYLFKFSFSCYGAQQFEDIGRHGTIVIIFNLWLNDEGIYELNFDDDDEVLHNLLISFISHC